MPTWRDAAPGPLSCLWLRVMITDMEDQQVQLAPDLFHVTASSSS